MRAARRPPDVADLAAVDDIARAAAAAQSYADAQRRAARRRRDATAPTSRVWVDTGRRRAIRPRPSDKEGEHGRARPRAGRADRSPRSAASAAACAPADPGGEPDDHRQGVEEARQGDLQTRRPAEVPAGLQRPLQARPPAPGARLPGRRERASSATRRCRRRSSDPDRLALQVRRLGRDRPQLRPGRRERRDHDSRSAGSTTSASARSGRSTTTSTTCTSTSRRAGDRPRRLGRRRGRAAAGHLPRGQAGRLGRARARRSRPASGGAGGIPFGPPDPKIAAIMCHVLDRSTSPPRSGSSAWETAIVESGVHNLPVRRPRLARRLPAAVDAGLGHARADAWTRTTRRASSSGGRRAIEHLYADAGAARAGGPALRPTPALRPARGPGGRARPEYCGLMRALATICVLAACLAGRGLRWRRQGARGHAGGRQRRRAARGDRVRRARGDRRSRSATRHGAKAAAGGRRHRRGRPRQPRGDRARRGWTSTGSRRSRRCAGRAGATRAATGRGDVEHAGLRPHLRTGRLEQLDGRDRAVGPRTLRRARRFYTRATMTYKEPGHGPHPGPDTYLRTPPC